MTGGTSNCCPCELCLPANTLQLVNPIYQGTHCNWTLAIAICEGTASI